MSLASEYSLLFLSDGPYVKSLCFLPTPMASAHLTAVIEKQKQKGIFNKSKPLFFTDLKSKIGLDGSLGFVFLTQ